MLPVSQRKCNISGGIALAGILGSVCVIVLSGPHNSDLHDIGAIMLMVGWISFVVGLCFYSEAKGYSPVIGILLGITGLIGLIILLVLEDKNPTAKTSPSPDIGDYKP